ncbi:LysM peptidoglycan-binding domain-containing protein, partial [Levilactobacillus brevis]|nr:LysM peptidoglycan-binding domain-containing protein [Levilactobacillus brevis]
MNIKKALVTTLGTVAVVGAGIFATNDTANADVKVTVKQGDSVWSLANKYDSSINAIEKANSLANDLIYVGQTLNVPNSTQAATTQAASVANNTYSHTTSQATTNTTTNTSTASASTGVSGSEASAKAWIANKE